MASDGPKKNLALTFSPAAQLRNPARMEATHLLDRNRYPEGARIHLIAVGGSVMHSLALALARSGCRVSGSDDVIRNPARDRLAAANLLPDAEGWFPDRVDDRVDAVVVGMHARMDNPELQRARALGLPIYSYPELVRGLARNQQRIVVGGSHGKSTTTALLMHVLGRLNLPFDYLVGASVPGFSHTLQLGSSAPVMLLEGDEYPAAAFDNRPKALVYEPHLLVMTGISWDHINVYPTEDSYFQAFAQLLAHLQKGGVCVYNKEDKQLRELVVRHLVKEQHEALPYSTPPIRIGRNGRMEVKLDGYRFEVALIGRHNAANLAAAWQVCQQLAIELPEFAAAAADFTGAGLRLETWRNDDRWVVLRDFAHAPSKVAATVEAVAEHWRERPIVAVLELHTYSSLNPEFIGHYRNTLKKARHRIVLVDRAVVGQKGTGAFTQGQLQKAFHERQLEVVTDRDELLQAVKRQAGSTGVLLLMSSGGLCQIEQAEWLHVVGR